MNLTLLVPLPYRIAALVAFAAALVAFGYVKGASHVHSEWDAAKAAQVAAENAAIGARVAANTKEAARQSEINATITKAKDEQIADIRARLAAERMRLPAFCSGPTATAETPRPSSSDGPDSTVRILPEQVERDIKALILQTEEVAATGRACQAFVTENGLSQ